MDRRPNQHYDESDWRYVLVPAVIWTFGVAAACVISLSLDDELVAPGSNPSSQAHPPGHAASVPPGFDRGQQAMAAAPLNR